MIEKILRFIVRKSLWYLYYAFYILPIDYYFRAKLFLGTFKEVEHQGLKAFGNKICVFASYPTAGILSHSLKRYINHLNELGYSILFISNAHINKQEIEWLKKICTRIIVRENFGLDFGAYKTGILKYQKQIQASDELLIANDSVIMITELNEMFNEMKTKNIDFWGASEAYGELYKNYHICSYFLVISKQIIQAKTFWHFWINYKLSQSKVLTIKLGETALTTIIKKSGYTSDAYINAQRITNFILKNNFSPAFVNMTLLNKTSLIPKNAPYTHKAPFDYNLSMLYMVYARNHNTLYMKAMIELGLPFIKKDSCSKQYYCMDEIYSLVQKIHPSVDVDNLTSELPRKILTFRPKHHILKLIHEY